MTNKPDEFTIQDCRLVSVKFDIDSTAAPKKAAEVNIDIILEHKYVDSSNTLHLIMGVNVVGKDFMNVSIRQEGLFKFETKPTPEIHLIKTAEITCAAILFPFVREFIADLTRRSGLAPLILDPVNFVQFYNANHA